MTIEESFTIAGYICSISVKMEDTEIKYFKVDARDMEW